MATVDAQNEEGGTHARRDFDERTPQNEDQNESQGSKSEIVDWKAVPIRIRSEKFRTLMKAIEADRKHENWKQKVKL